MSMLSDLTFLTVYILFKLWLLKKALACAADLLAARDGGRGLNSFIGGVEALCHTLD